jgi:mRNA-degrading endonuclease RelE of RelBE toxin-antitoxin system
VIITEAAQEQIEDLPRAIHARVLDIIERLSKWPDVSGAKPLRAELAGQYRVRTGGYRVQFRVDGKGATASLTVVRVGKRDRFYK